MDYQALKAELLAGTYSADDATAANELNAVNIERNRTSMSGSELFDATEAASYNALSDAKKARWIAFCAIDTLDPFGPAVQIVTEIWGAGSPTVLALAAARTETVSRATELGFGVVHIGDIQNARSI